MSDVRCQMSDVAHWTGVYNIDEDDYCLPLVLLNVRCQMSDVRCSSLDWRVQY